MPNTRFLRSTRVLRRLLPAISLAALALPTTAFADASADSKGSDWWGDNSGWQWNWPGIARKPGGNVVGEYKHWFEGGQPAAWTGHGPAIWTLPANVAEFPRWPGKLVGDTGGDGAFSTDTHTDQATSDWRWEAYRNNLFPSEIVFLKGTTAYANAKSIPNVRTAAHSRTRLVDPRDFENPNQGEEWSMFGRIAPEGTLNVNEDSDEEASAFFELSYSASVDGGDPTEVLRLHVGVDGENEDVSLFYAPNVHFFRLGEEISAAQIIDELTAFYQPDLNWALTRPPGEALNEGYYFDLAINLPGSADTATLYSTPVAGANDTRFSSVPEPAPLALVSAGLLAAWRVRRRTQSRPD